jgi:hypothetical protein
VAIRLGFASLCAVLVSAGPGALAQGAHDELIAKHAAAHGVPEPLVRRVITIESRGNANAVSKGNYGLMQIRLGTARAMGYGGDADGLLDADTNLKYAVKYLAGAYRAAGCNVERAIALYQRGYHGVRATCATPAQSERGFMLAQAQTKSVGSPAAGADVIKPKVVHTVTVPRPPRRSAAASADASSAPQAAPAKVPPADRPEPIKSHAGTGPANAPRPTVASAPQAEGAVPTSTRKSDALVPRAALKPPAAPQAAAISVAAPVAPERPEPVAQPKPAEPAIAAVTTGAASNAAPDAAANPDAAAKIPAAKQERKHVRAAATHAPKEPPRKRQPASKQDEDLPNKVVSFFKKLVTPDQKTEPKPARKPREQNLQAVR